MSLDKASLKSGIETLLNDIRESEGSDAEFAQGLANLIDTFVKTATINYSTGLIAPSGTAGGPVTGTFTGNLS